MDRRRAYAAEGGAHDEYGGDEEESYRGAQRGEYEDQHQGSSGYVNMEEDDQGYPGEEYDGEAAEGAGAGRPAVGHSTRGSMTKDLKKMLADGGSGNSVRYADLRKSMAVEAELDRPLSELLGHVDETLVSYMVRTFVSLTT